MMHSQKYMKFTDRVNLSGDFGLDFFQAGG